MKIRKKLAAMLLSVATVFSLIPAGAMAATNTFGAPADVTVPSIDQPVVPDTNLSTTSGTLTITKKGARSTFNIYQLYSMKVNTPQEKIYTYTAATKADKTTPLYAGLPDIKTLHTDDAAALSALAANLHSQITAGSIAYTRTASTAGSGDVDKNTDYTTTFSDVPLGYYLVIETSTTGLKTASKDFFVSVPSVTIPSDPKTAPTWNYDVKVNCKDTPIKFDKTITDNITDLKTVDRDGVTRNIGDEVDYRLDADVPKYDDQATNITFTMHDTLSKGLALDYPTDHTKMIVTGLLGGGKTTLTEGTDYKVNVTGNSTTATNVTITFTYANIAKYDSVSVNYSAKLTKDAIIGKAGNPNEAYLDYSQKPYDITHSDHHKTYVYTFGLQILKLGSTDSHPALQNAEFTLYANYDSTTKTASNQIGLPQLTNSNGTLNFDGLKDGTYYVKETKAPDGYSLLDGVITVQIIASTVKVTASDGTTTDQPTGDFSWQYKLNPTDNWTVHSVDDSKFYTYSTDTTPIKIYALFTVYDDKGFVLPGTGGIGTTIFFVSGIAILLLGGCLAFVYTRKKRTGSHFQH